MYEVEIFNGFTNPPAWWCKFAIPKTQFGDKVWTEELLKENIIEFRVENKDPFRRVATFRNKGDYLLMVMKWS